MCKNPTTTSICFYGHLLVLHFICIMRSINNVNSGVRKLWMFFYLLVYSNRLIDLPIFRRYNTLKWWYELFAIPPTQTEAADAILSSSTKLLVIENARTISQQITACFNDESKTRIAGNAHRGWSADLEYTVQTCVHIFALERQVCEFAPQVKTVAVYYQFYAQP